MIKTCKAVHINDLNDNKKTNASIKASSYILPLIVAGNNYGVLPETVKARCLKALVPRKNKNFLKQLKICPTFIVVLGQSN